MATETDTAKDQAQAQYESIVNMLARMDHLRDCDGDDCELTSDEILEGLGYSQLGGASDEDRREYHDEDQAREAIDNDPLSIEVRSGWHSPGESGEDEEFSILLCTGGPAVRIRGELDEYNQACRAWLEYQDWFTPWQEYIPQGSNKVLCEFANYFLGY